MLMYRHLLQKRCPTTLCPEFSNNARKTAMIVGALYGLKSAGAAFRSHCAKCMESLGYESCKSDSDLWLKPEIWWEDGVQYYSYLVCYVDDILCIHHNAGKVLKWLHKSFPLKPGFVIPDMYLSAKLHKTRLHNGVFVWANSSVKYVWEQPETAQVTQQSILVVDLGCIRRQRLHLRSVMIQSCILVQS